MGNPRSWAGYMAAVAVGLAPDQLVLSTGSIGRLLRRLAPSRAEMRQPESAAAARAANHHDLRLAEGERV
jgi:hypothetical protein